jgi:prephenate dehydratase
MSKAPRGTTVAFQGVHGAYSEMACRQLFGAGIKTVPCETFEAVFAAVERGQVRYGVLPIENSLAGSIHLNYDLLAQHDLPIVGETHLRVRHCLLCHPSTSRDKITEVRSHPQALAQCSGLFAVKKRGAKSGNRAATKPALKPVVWFDTAGAAQSLVEEKPAHVAAIASEWAAQLYKLKILDQGIANQPFNFTRFLAITKPALQKPAKGKAAPSRAKRNDAATLKTSIAYIPPVNEVGVLFKVLGIFALRQIDLVKIESRPNPLKPFEYRFYLDLIGDAHVGPLSKALDQLREIGGELQVLGTYPAGEAPTPSSTKAEK